MSFQEKFMLEAIALAEEGMNQNLGGPFGCVIVKDGKIIGKGNNQVTSSNDPTAHAEVVAIRNACKEIGSFQLSGCEVYTSCEPCPMCFGAIYWARPDKVYYAASKQDAANAGFDDSFIYHELELIPEKRSIPLVQEMQQDAIDLFNRWQTKQDKTSY